MQLKLIQLAFFTAISLLINSCEGNTFKQGEMLYKNHCSGCHMEHGQGLQSLIPPLAGFNYLAENRAGIACIITNGLKDTLRYGDKVYSEAMLPIPNLTDAELTNIINFINQAWCNDFGYVKIKDVQEALRKCKS